MSTRRSGRLEALGSPGALVSGAAAPATTPAERLRQMRDLAREFHIVMETESGRSDLRLLTQPVYRYEAKTDGALFAFVLTTDPEAWLLIEERERRGNAGLALRIRPDEQPGPHRATSRSRSLECSEGPFLQRSLKALFCCGGLRPGAGALIDGGRLSTTLGVKARSGTASSFKARCSPMRYPATADTIVQQLRDRRQIVIVTRAPDSTLPAIYLKTGRRKELRHPLGSREPGRSGKRSAP